MNTRLRHLWAIIGLAAALTVVQACLTYVSYIREGCL
jgi:hypothetical protein